MGIVRKGLLDVVHGERGTARNYARIKGVMVAGKTGTAQVFSRKKGEKIDSDNLTYELRDHAWFVSYAPAQNPVIAVSVIIEHGEHGSSSAGPIAKDVMERYLRRLGLIKKESQ